MFMYGNNTSEVEADDGVGAAQAYLRERLFPWLMSQRVSCAVQEGGGGEGGLNSERETNCNRSVFCSYLFSYL